MSLPQVVVFHRNAQQQLLAVRPVGALQWTRRFAGSGSFRADFDLQHGRAIDCGHILDVELDGLTDFTGIVQSRRLVLRPERLPVWRLEGLDLTWWLHQRVIVPPAAASHDEQLAVPAEDAIRHYIDDHLLNPVDTDRAIPVPALLAPANTPRLGPTVTVRARYTNLAKQIDTIAVGAGLGYRALRNADGQIEFAVLAPRDRTASSPQPVIFSTALGTAEELSFTEDGVRNRNTAYVLGVGQGDTRLVETVIDAADVALHDRRELALDARDATTSAAAIDAGNAELARQAAIRLRLDAQPPALSPLAYRDTWDVGDVVSLDIPDIDLRTDQRIDSVRLTVDAEQPLRIVCAFGAPPPDAATTLRRLDERTAPARLI